MRFAGLALEMEGVDETRSIYIDFLIRNSFRYQVDIVTDARDTISALKVLVDLMIVCFKDADE